MTPTLQKYLTLATAATAATAALGGMAGSAEAAIFGTDGIQFDDDTTVNFTFRESHGAYQSDLRVYEVVNGAVVEDSAFVLFSETRGSDNGGANEWQGTFGNAVTSESGSQTVSFKFTAGKIYTLGLNSKHGNHNKPRVYSTSRLNLFDGSNTQQAVFGSEIFEELDISTTNTFAQAANRVMADPFVNGGVDVGFDDRGNRNDTDFQDFVVTASAVRPETPSIRSEAPRERVPEPASVAGLGFAATTVVLSRRRKKAEA